MVVLSWIASESRVGQNSSVELVAKAAARASTAGIPGEALPTPAAWMRVVIAPGVEIHLREHTKRPKPAELKQWISLLETALRKNL